MVRTDANAIKPPPLVAGDLVRIVSPASPILSEKTEFAAGFLRSEGYEVEFGQHAFESDHYLAGSDRLRAEDLMNAFLDNRVKAVFCSRGGYGCARLLPYLDLDAMASSNKLFLGFSDVTTLHIALNNRGVATVHAPMALTLSVPRQDWVYKSFQAALTGGNPIPEDAPKGECVVGGAAEGRVVGGCMCLVCDSIGTRDQIDAEGNILILEDVDENPHRVDAMLTHLLNSKIIQRAAGIVVGEMTGTDSKQDEGIGGMPWKEIFRDRLAGLGIPMIWDFPFGHNKNMLSLPLGVRARLEAGRGSLDYLESHCS